MTKFTNRKEIRHVCGNRPGFHIFIISALARNVKYILTKIRVVQGSCLRVVGGDSPSRRCTCSPYKPPSKWQTPPICHCEEAAGRRGNLGKAAAFSPIAFPRCGRVLRDCHVASLLAMTRQGSARCTSALVRLNIPCTRRSVSAATDAIGLYVFTAACTICECLPEIATGAERPRNDKLGGHCLFNIGPHFPPVQRQERHAAPLQCTAGGLCIFHSSFFSLQDSFPCAPPLQRTNGNFPLPSRSSSTHNITNIFVLWKKHKNPRGNPKRSLIIPSRRDLTNAGKCDKIKAQRESGAFKNTDPVFRDRAAGSVRCRPSGHTCVCGRCAVFFRRGREENQNV